MQHGLILERGLEQPRTRFDLDLTCVNRFSQGWVEP